MSTERVRKFWNKRPCNFFHSRQPVGTRAYFDEVEARKYMVEPHIPAFADFDRWAGKKVLELGCGMGTDSINFARAGARVTVVDLSEVSLRLCEDRFKVYGLEDEAEFYRGDMENLKKFLPLEQFDLVYAFGSIHHTPNPERVFEQIKRYCHADTEVRVMVYSRWSWKVIVDIILRKGHGAFWRWKELVREHSEAQTGSPETYDYSFEGIRKLMKGFQVVSLEKAHIFPYIVSKYVKHEYEREWYFKLMPKFLFSWLERQLGWHTLVVARLGEKS
jgi:ubiquinone/menaquinone biosynthesis C-methylase UbiE